MKKQQRNPGGIFLPKGLVYFEKSASGGHCEGWSPSDPITYHKDNFIVISSRATKNCSENLVYRLGSGKYVPTDRKTVKSGGEEYFEYKHGVKGDVFYTNGYQFKAFFEVRSSVPTIKLLTLQEFQKLITDLKDADLEKVREELKFLDQPGGSQGCRMAPGYAYSRENRTYPATRIDKLILENTYHLTPDKLIRTPPKLEAIIKRGNSRGVNPWD